MKKRIKPPKIIAAIIMMIICLMWVLPLIYGIFTTFKSEVEIKAVNFHFIPEQWVFSNYENVLKNTGNTPVIRWFINSTIISSCTCILVIFIVSLAAYGYTRLVWKNQNKFFYALLALSLFPQIVNIIPLYRIMTILNWVNSIPAVIVPALGGVVNIFLVRQFMLGIPRDYDEAAKIDGTGDFSIYFYIILPMVKPVLTVVALFTFTSQWNDLLWPAIVFNDIDKIPLTPGLQLLMGSYGNFFLGAIMTGAVLAVIPTFVLYFFAQKYFMTSLSLSSGVKG